MIDVGSLIVVDTETTGADPFSHELLSVALVSLSSNSEFVGHAQLAEDSVWTEFGQANFAQSKKDWERTAVPAEMLVPQIEKFVRAVHPKGPVVLIGHNVAFDRFFLAKLARRAGLDGVSGISHRTIDTHTLLSALNLMDKIPDYALSSEGAFKHFGVRVPPHERHTALGDARAAKQLFLHLVAELAGSPARMPGLEGLLTSLATTSEKPSRVEN